MKVRNLVLAGALFALTALTSDAQWRRGTGGRGYSSFYSGRNYNQNAFNYNSGYRGFPNYSYGFNSYNRGYNFGSAFGYRTPYSYGTQYSYGTPYYGRSYSYGTPYNNQNYYYSTPTVVVTPQSTILPTTHTVAPATETGLRIASLADGTAKRAGLRPGDIILKVNERRTQNFETLRDVLSTSGKSQVEIEFVDASDNTVQRRSVGVENTKIGVYVEEVAVDRK